MYYTRTAIEPRGDSANSRLPPLAGDLRLVFAILLIGLPIVLAVRGVAEAIAWLLARIVG